MTFVSLLFFLFKSSASVDIPFSVPIVREPTAEGIPLAIPLSLASNHSQVKISMIDCGNVFSIQTAFISSYSGSIHHTPLSYFKSPNRPMWTVGVSPPLSVVCVDGKQIGFFDYYEPPILSVPSNHPPYPKTLIQVRDFMNPGWVQEMPSVPCSGCDTVRNSFVFKELHSEKTACSGHREEMNFLSRFNTTKGSAVNIFPFKITIEHMGGTIGDVLHSWTFSTDHIVMTRPDSDNGFPILGKIIHVCFYPDENSDEGTYLADAVFILSEKDTSALVIFLLFVGIALPSICMITTALYCYKFKRHRQWLRSVRHYVQSVQLETEMQNRNYLVIERVSTE
jgi:hypothetical protein